MIDDNETRSGDRPNEESTGAGTFGDRLTELGYEVVERLQRPGTQAVAADGDRIAFVADGTVEYLSSEATTPEPVPGFTAPEPKTLCFGRGEHLYVLDGSDIVPLLTTSPLNERWDQWSELVDIEAFTTQSTLAALTATGDVLFLDAVDGRKRARLESGGLRLDHILAHGDHLVGAAGSELVWYDPQAGRQFGADLPASAEALAAVDDQLVVSCADGRLYWYTGDGTRVADADGTVDRFVTDGAVVAVGTAGDEAVVCGPDGTIEHAGELDGTLAVTHDAARLALLGEDGRLLEYDGKPSVALERDSVPVGTQSLTVSLYNPRPIRYEFVLRVTASDESDTRGGFTVMLEPGEEFSLQVPVGGFTDRPTTIELTVDTPAGTVTEQFSVERVTGPAVESGADGDRPDDRPEPASGSGVTEPPTTDDGSGPTDPPTVDETEERRGERWRPSDDTETPERPEPSAADAENSERLASATDEEDLPDSAADRERDDGEAGPPEAGSADAPVDTTHLSASLTVVEERDDGYVVALTVTNDSVRRYSAFGFEAAPDEFETRTRDEEIPPGGEASVEFVGRAAPGTTLSVTPTVGGRPLPRTTVDLPGRAVTVDVECDDDGPLRISVENHREDPADEHVELAFEHESVSFDLTLRPGANWIVLPLVALPSGVPEVTVSLSSVDETWTADLPTEGPGAVTEPVVDVEESIIFAVRDGDFHSGFTARDAGSEVTADADILSPVCQSLSVESVAGVPVEGLELVGTGGETTAMEGPLLSTEATRFVRGVDVVGGTAGFPPWRIEDGDGAVVAEGEATEVPVARKSLDVRVRLQRVRSLGTVLSVAVENDTDRRFVVKRISDSTTGSRISVAPRLSIPPGRTYWSTVTDSSDIREVDFLELRLLSGSTERELLTVPHVFDSIDALPFTVGAGLDSWGRKVAVTFSGEVTDLEGVGWGLPDGYENERLENNEITLDRLERHSIDRYTLPMYLNPGGDGDWERRPYLLSVGDGADVTPVAGPDGIDEFFDDDVWPEALRTGWVRMGSERL